MEKHKHCIPPPNRPPLIHNNKNKYKNNKAKPSKDKLAHTTHQYPTRLNAKKHKQHPDTKPEQPPYKLEPQQQTKCTEQTQESENTTPPIINPQLLDYKSQILTYVSQRQHMMTIDVAYLRIHKTFTPKMRSFLVRHFFKIYLKFNLRRTTLHLAVNYMDLYFWRKQHEVIDQLQTVALAQTCLFIAMKYEEIYPPEFASWLDHRHLRNIIKLEAEVLSVLDFQLAQYTLQHFLDITLCEFGQQSQQLLQASQMHLLVDLTLFDLNIRQFKACELAHCIYELTHQGKENENHHKSIALNVKWMVERNQQALTWLIQQKYCKVLPSHLL